MTKRLIALSIALMPLVALAQEATDPGNNETTGQIPEPSTVALLAMGAGVALYLARRRK